MKKTNAIRLLEREQIVYQTVPYVYDPNNLDVGHIAKENALPVHQVYKTLVLRGNKVPVLVAVVAGNAVLDLKALAKASDNKRVYMAAVKELQALTGYIRGGCCPLGMKKAYPVFLDVSAMTQDRIYVNAGVRGLLIGLDPQDLIMACDGKFADIAHLSAS